jgi:cysteine desulfurase family protein (TIGR01976 family)
MAEFMNVGETGSVVLGPSTTALINLVAAAYSQVWAPGDEVIIAETNHEANVGAWNRLSNQGIEVKWWKVHPDSHRCESDDLKGLLTERTKMVTMPHVSNLVGQIEDVEAVCRITHAAGARVFVDGVAFAPHRTIDVQQLDVDWYVFSTYKVYGPHMAAMYGRADAIGALTGPNHWFVPKEDPYKWELGGVSHEACAGLLGLKSYFGFLAQEPYAGRPTVVKAFERMMALEEPVDRKLREWLSGTHVKIVGPSAPGQTTVGTVSFVDPDRRSDDIARQVNQASIGIRNGHMYAVRLLEGLGIPPDPGVVRVSAVHYNTTDEIGRLIGVLQLP